MLQPRFLRVLANLAILAVVGCGPLPYSSYRDKFDARVWAEASSWAGPDRPTPRQRMLGDLMKRVLPGLDREAVLSLLGPPVQDKMKVADMAWSLGPERGFMGIDSEWLLVWYDASGKVVRSELGHD